MLEAFLEKVQKCVSSYERGKWICAVSSKYDGKGKGLNLLVSKVRGISCGGLEILMQ